MKSEFAEIVARIAPRLSSPTVEKLEGFEERLRDLEEFVDSVANDPESDHCITARHLQGER